MKNLPKKIYLQIDADGETPEDFNELVGITWCTDKINPNDIEFILNEEIRESCKFNCLDKKDGPECYKVLGRCIVCPHYSQLNAERT